VDIFAPGDEIYSCESGFPFGYTDRYCLYDGTSQAAPYVAGVAALLLSEYPDMDADDIKMTIMENAVKPRGDDPDDPDTYDQYLLEGLCVTGGILNARDALQNPVYHTHTYNIPTDYNNTYHRNSCLCGAYSGVSAHQYTEAIDYGNLTYHKLLCICGHEGGLEEHTWELNYSGNSVGDASINYVPEYKCRKCNAITLFPGVIS